MTVVVVGAGVAGLHVAESLRRAHSEDDVVLLEARPAPGGRVRTSYDEATGEVEYEAGPWRIPADHRRARALFARHGLPLLPLATPSPPVSRGGGTDAAVRPGHSIWEMHALSSAFRGDVHKADLADLATGYADQTSAASGSAPYTTKSREFFVCPLGFSALTNRMASGLGKDVVRYDHRVVDVTVVTVVGGDGGDGGDGTPSYLVHVVRRVGASEFEPLPPLACDTLFVCVPPSIGREWSALRHHARSTLCAVTEGALCHVYVRHAHPPRVHHKAPDSILAQTISSQYGNDWFQASYSGGRIARLWHHLRSRSVAEFWSVLRRALRDTHGLHVPEAAEHRTHYWPRAYHLWRPAPGFDLPRAVRHAVEPNPRELPGLYLAGEAFSSHQAWIEGALETADLALARHARREDGPLPARDGETRVDGCCVDVRAWTASHPGGRGALANHAGEDLGVYMRHVGHSDEAWGVAHSLKRG
jgi:hypothetical protein